MTANDPTDDEFENDRRVLEEALDKFLDEDEDPDGGDPHEHLEAAEVIRKFHVKYRVRLEAHGVDVTAFLRDLAESVKIYAKAVKKEDAAVEVHLQSKAELARMEAELTEREFKILHYLDNMTEAQWATVPEEHREEVRAAIENVRKAMPEYLAALPIEKRRELEGLK